MKISPSKIIKQDDGIIDTDKQLDKVIEALLDSRLKEADKLIEEGFHACKTLIGSQEPEVKDKLKKCARAFANYKLTHRISSISAHLKQQVGQ